MDTEEIIRAEYAACGVYEDLDSSTDGDEMFGFKESKLSPTRKTGSSSQNSSTKSRKVSQFRDLRGHSDDVCVIERESGGSLPCVEAILEVQDLRARSNSITESVEDDPNIDGASDNETEVSEDGVTPECFTTTVDEEVEEGDVAKEVEEDDVVKEVHKIDGIHPGELPSDKRSSHAAAELHHDEGVECPDSLNALNGGGKEREEADESEYHGEVDEGAYDSEEFELDGDGNGNGDDQETTVRGHVTEYGEELTLTQEDVSNGDKNSVGALEGLVVCESDVTTQNKKEAEGRLFDTSGHDVEGHSLHLKAVSPIDPQEPSTPPVNMRGASNRIRHKKKVESSVRWNGNTEERCDSVIEKRKNIPSNSLPSILLAGSGSGSGSGTGSRVDSSMRASNVSLYDLALNGSPVHTVGAHTSYIVTYPCPHPHPHPQPPTAHNTYARTEASTSSIGKVEETSNHRNVAQHKNLLTRNVLKAKKQGYVSRLQQQSNKEAAVRLLKGRVDAAMMKKRMNMSKGVRDRDVHEATYNNQVYYGHDKSGYNSDYIESNSNHNDCKNLHRDYMGVQSNIRDSNASSSKRNIDNGRDRSRDRGSDRGSESTHSNIQDNNKRYYDTPSRSAPTLPRTPARTVMPAIRALGRLSLSPVRQRKGGVAVGETHKHPTLFKRPILPLDDDRLQDCNDR